MAKIEVHRAQVTRNIDDDEGLKLRGAIFFNAPTLFDGEYELPAVPCFPFASANGAGMFWVPQVGDEIEVQILADDNTDDTTDVELPEPTYLCMLYSDADDADIDDIFKENYTKRMGWKSNSGHYFLFDDKEDVEFYEMVSGKGHQLKFDDAKGNESVLLKHLIGTMLQIDKEGTLTETIVKDRLIDIAGDKTETIGGDETVTVTGDRTHTAANHTLDSSGDIKFGSSGAAENLILGLQFQILYNAETHIGNLGIPTGVPIVPMTVAQLASKVFTEA